MKDATVRQALSEVKISLMERAQYFQANQLHQQMAALRAEYQTIQYELQGKDAS